MGQALQVLKELLAPARPHYRSRAISQLTAAAVSSAATDQVYLFLVKWNQALTLNHLIVSNGVGGAIHNQGALTLNNVVVRDSERSGNGGGIFLRSQPVQSDHQ